MDQIEKVPPPMVTPQVKASPQGGSEPSADENAGKLKVTAYVENGRLQLTADVGLDEIEGLREMLEGYKTILKFVN